jgi:tetratricopeptide (TPR) repeat protein
MAAGNLRSLYEALGACLLGAAAVMLCAGSLAAAPQDHAPGEESRPSRDRQQERSPEEQLLDIEPKESEASREEVLEDLFRRVRKAADADTAKAVAETIQKVWLQSGSDTVNLLMSRAREMVEAENLDLALDILDSVVAIAPDYPEGWNQRASIFFLKEDYRRSLDDLRHVLALEPRHFKAINGLSIIMRELGQKEAALKAVRKLLEVHPQSPEARRMEEELAREVEGQGI